MATARNRPASLHPDDSHRLAALEARVDRRMAAVDESMSKITAFADRVERGEGGVVLDHVHDEDSLVIHLEAVVRSVA